MSGAVTAAPQRARPGWSGPLAPILVATALQAAVQGTLTGWIDPARSLLFSALAFCLAAVVFGIVQRWRDGAWIADAGLRENRGAMIGINVATAVTFLSFYVSLSLVPASTTGALEAAFGPLAVAVLARSLTGRRIVLTGTGRMLVAALVVLGLLLAARSWAVDGGAGDTGAAPLGVLLGVVAGWGMAAVTLLSRRLGDAGVGAVPVTAHRFHLTYVLAAALWWAGDPVAPSAGEVGLLLALGVAAVVVPLFLLQVGLQRAEPMAAMAIVVTLPGLTYVVQLLAGSPFDPVALALVTGVIVVSGVYSARPRQQGADGRAADRTAPG